MRFLKRHKKAFITALISLCLVMMAAAGINKINSRFFGDALGYVLTPVEGFFEFLRQKGGGVTGFFGSIGSLSEENARLREEVDALKADNIRLSQAEKDLDKLTKLLNIAEKYNDYPVMGAEIIAKDPGNWYNAYFIDKGKRDGLRKNMMVLSDGGLAGRLTEVYETYSKVVSLIDDTSRAAAMSARSGGTGFVRGDVFLMDMGLCRMEQIPEEADIREGDVIVTGRLSTLYPAGIAIGEVTEITRSPSGEQSAIVKPYVDFKYMETVLVVTEMFDRAVSGGE